ATEIGDGLATELCRAAEAITSPFSALLCMQMGGAPARVPIGDTAVGIREAQYGLVFQSAWTDPVEDSQHIAWARNAVAAVRPFTSGSTYVNFITADEGPARVPGAYADETFQRLRQIKTTRDPQNLFGGTLNIPPAARS